MLTTLKRLSLVIASVGMLTIYGCGGGGGGGVGDSTSVTLSGSAVKGPLANAKISIYKIVDGAQGDLLQAVTSDANGRYSATVTGYTGVVLVIASVIPGTTTMFDEATGQTIKPTDDFSMRASFVAQSGVTYSTQINPYTDLATATALAKTGGLSEANVKDANSDMAEALQFDPLTTVAIFNADNQPTNPAAVALAAISQMAAAGDRGCTGDQNVKITCITTALTTLGLGNADIRNALQTNIVAITTNLGLLSQTVTDPATAGSGTPAPVATPVEQAKAFIGTLRSNAKALDATDLSLQTELQKVSDDLSGRTAPIATSNINALTVAFEAANFWNEVMIMNPTADFVQSRTIGSLGSCGFYQDTDYNVKATGRTNANYVACGVSSKFNDFIWATGANGEYTQCKALGDVCGTQWSTRVRLNPDAGDANKFTVYTQTRATKIVVLSIDPFKQGEDKTDKSARKEYGAPFPGNAATLTTQRDTMGHLSAVNLSGELSPAFSVTYNPISFYDADQQLWVYKPNQVATVFGDKHNVVLSGALTQVGGLEKLAVSGSMELIKAGALETRIELADGSYLQATPDGTGGYSTTDGSQEMLLKLKAGSSASSFAGDLKISDFKMDASGTTYIPTFMSFSGSVLRNGVSFLEGTITGEALNHATFKSNEPLSSSNVQTMRVGFVGSVIIPNRPVLTASLSFTENDTGNFDTHTFALSGQYKQGYTTINVSGATSSTSDIVTLESTTGMKLVVDQSREFYPLTNNGEAVGSFDPIKYLLTYTDGTYEQF